MDDGEKILINKEESVDDVIGKLAAAQAERVVLTVPRFAKITEAPTHFQLLKEKALTLGKDLIVESVDDAVQQRCNQYEIAYYNPFFVRSRRQFSDIVSTRGGQKTTKRAPVKKSASTKMMAEPEELEEVDDEQDVVVPTQPRVDRVDTVTPAPSKKKGRRLMILVAGVVGVATVVFAATMLPRATATLRMQTEEWKLEKELTVSHATSKLTDSGMVPGQLFVHEKNGSFTFPATDFKDVERKASGVITIYNAFNTQTQVLVATTRFQAPDGKIFRLKDRVTVPAGKMVDGKLVAGSIDAEVVADKAGESYNIGPVERFTIPGFKGSARYDAFYAESSAPMTGGFIGETAVPTEADVVNAKTSVEKAIRDSLYATVKTQLPEGMTLLDDGVHFAMTREQVDLNTNEKDEFSVFAAGELRTIVFRESDIIDFMNARIAEDQGDEFIVRDYQLTYGTPKFDAQKNTMLLPVSFTAVLARDVDVQALIQQIRGKSEEDLRRIVLAVPGVSKAEISLWPFWVRSVPKEDERITISVQ